MGMLKLVNIEAAAKNLVTTNVSDRPTLNNKMNKQTICG